jgi:zinc resistance-associated protein
MKKLIIVSIGVVFLGLVASQALACWWDGYRGGHMGGAWSDYCWSGYTGAGSQEFLDETATLRQELAAKQGEYSALMTQGNPDPKGAADLSRQIVNLQDQIHAKARARGFAGPGAYARGPGHGGMGCW